VAVSKTNLAFIRRRPGRGKEAGDLWQQAKGVYEAVGDTRSACIALSSLALLHKNFEAALVIARKVHNERSMGQVTSNRGLLLLDRAQPGSSLPLATGNRQLRRSKSAKTLASEPATSTFQLAADIERTEQALNEARD
jgi:hypothetical protein